VTAAGAPPRTSEQGEASAPGASGSVVPPFDLRAALPSGLTLLEASAGTGKTYALAALATRFVAEHGLSASELCIVTFTEAATAELRGRVRSRFGEAAAHLEAGGGASDDEVLDLLGGGDPGTLARRAANLRRALADFDAATISTIHGFCSRLVGRSPGGGALTDDDGDLRELVIDRFLSDLGDEDPPLPLEKVVEAVELRMRMPDAAMFTVDLDGLDDAARVRARRVAEAAGFVDDLVDEARARRSERRTRTFDSLLVEARDVLLGADGPAVVDALRRRYRLVMIDEFQDTDAVQWAIFRTAFLDRPGPDAAPVVLVGDPKQSIYRFRSAELSAYLAARRHTLAAGGGLAGLTVNRRTDRPLLEALELLFSGATFGAPEVAFQPVEAAPGHDTGRLLGTDGASLQFRVLPEGAPTGECRSVAVADLTACVVELLSGAHIADGEGGSRPVRPGDIGILVRSNRDAAAYADALGAAGVPAARSSSDSVLDSRAADEWRTLLLALDRPGSSARARAAYVGWFLGRSPAELDALDDDGTADLVEVLRSWSSCLAERGLPALLGALRDNGLLGRVLAQRGGERDLTDLDHVAELLGAATGGRRTAPAALLAVLDQLEATGAVADDEGVTSDVLARRIDRDDDTVTILTVHKAKGLEFPVVLCPTLWTPPMGITALGHAHVDGRRLIDTDAVARPRGTKVSGRKAEAVFASVAAANRAEHEAEALRLLYVALTRAKHRLVLWWARPPRTSPSSLTHLLVAAGDGTVDLQALAGRSEGRIGLAEARRPATPTRWEPEAPDPQPLVAAVAERRIDRTWARWSFTGIERAARSLAAHRAPEVERPVPALESLMAVPPDLPLEGGHDELAVTDDDLDEPTMPDLAELARLALAGVAGGRELGVLVHAVLERADFASPTLAQDLRALCAERLAYRRLDIDADRLADGLVAALHAPLGGPLGPTRLVDLTRRQRLDELEFDLPLGRFDAAAIGRVLCVHLAPTDPLRPWAEHAAAGALHVDVEGMLTGSIDMVARTADGRYWLADHKTNRLPDGHYDGPALAQIMSAQGYPLQAALYLVALHRYLRWRVPAYDPARHLVGAAYLFVRGMDPSRPADDARGVHWFTPPPAAIDALDVLLATGSAP
jgi:exodeoxyribonuclease V beta subunit